MVSHLLNIDAGLAETVAKGLRLKEMPKPATAARPTRQDLKPSPTLSIIKNGPKSFAGRKVGALVTDGVDAAVLAALGKALKAEGAMLKLVAPEVGGVKDSAGTWHDADEKLEGGPSVLFDAVAILPSKEGATLLTTLPAARDFVADATAHRKFIAYGADAAPLLEKAGVAGTRRGLHPAQQGRRLRRLRRRVPQAPLLGPRRRRAINRPNSILELSLRHVLHAIQYSGDVVPGAALHRDPRRGDLPALSVVRRLSRRRANPGPGRDGQGTGGRSSLQARCPARRPTTVTVTGRRIFRFDPGWNTPTLELAAALALLVWATVGRLVGHGLSMLTLRSGTNPPSSPDVGAKSRAAQQEPGEQETAASRKPGVRSRTIECRVFTRPMRTLRVSGRARCT